MRYVLQVFDSMSNNAPQIIIIASVSSFIDFLGAGIIFMIMSDICQQIPAVWFHVVRVAYRVYQLYAVTLLKQFIFPKRCGGSPRSPAQYCPSGIRLLCLMVRLYSFRPVHSIRRPPVERTHKRGARYDTNLPIGKPFLQHASSSLSSCTFRLCSAQLSIPMVLHNSPRLTLIRQISF